MARFPGVRSSSIKGAASRLARPASHLSGDPISVVTKGGTLCFSTSAFCSISFRAGCTDRSPGGFNLMMWMTTDLQSQGVSPTVLRVPIENLNASCTNSFRFFLGSHAVYPALPEIALTRTNCGARNVRRGNHRGRDRRDGDRGAAPGARPDDRCPGGSRPARRLRRLLPAKGLFASMWVPPHSSTSDPAALAANC